MENRNGRELKELIVEAIREIHNIWCTIRPKKYSTAIIREDSTHELIDECSIPQFDKAMYYEVPDAVDEFLLML